MLAKRIIARLDIKPPNLVKGYQMEGLRVIGDPHDFAMRYYRDGADELLYVDVDASLDGRSALDVLICRTAEGIFIPLTVAGGIRSVLDIRRMVLSGADKVCINTAAIRSPSFITEASRAFGSQAIVVAVEYTKGMAFTDNGREPTGLDAYDWCRKAVDLGAGELMLTSIEREGTRKGYDCDFIRKVSEAVHVPVIAHGGAGNAAHLTAALDAGASGVCIAGILHHGKTTISQLKKGIHGHAIRAA